MEAQEWVEWAAPQQVEWAELVDWRGWVEWVALVEWVEWAEAVDSVLFQCGGAGAG